MLQANAVAARIDLDLRVGAALTRTQTMGLQARFGELAEKVISYGASLRLSSSLSLAFRDPRPSAS